MTIIGLLNNVQISRPLHEMQR